MECQRKRRRVRYVKKVMEGKLTEARRKRASEGLVQVFFFSRQFLVGDLLGINAEAYTGITVDEVL